MVEKSPDGGFYVGNGLHVDGNTISVSQMNNKSQDDIILVHFYTIYSDSGDSIGMQSAIAVDEISPSIKANKLVIGHNSDHHTMTPLFIYDYDTDEYNNITAIYWFQHNIEDDRILCYKQTDTHIVEKLTRR